MEGTCEFFLLATALRRRRPRLTSPSLTQILAIESFANRARGKARGHVPNIVVDLGEEEEEEDEDVAASVETGTDAADDSDDE